MWDVFQTLSVDYYRRFVEGFPSIVAPVLVLPIGSRPYIVYCDASRVDLRTVLVQNGRVFTYV